MNRISVFWFRRDLRIHDNYGLYRALSGPECILPVFIFDKNILKKTETKYDARVEFIHQTINKLKQEFEKRGSSLLVIHNTPEEAFKQLKSEYLIQSVYVNTDYEPYGIERDKKIELFCYNDGIDFHSYKDHVVFEKNEVVKSNCSPYTVFTPYMRKWKNMFMQKNESMQFDSEKMLHKLFRTGPTQMPALKELGFRTTGISFPSSEINTDIIQNYDKTRDFPYLSKTSKLGLHLRFGTISIRKLVNIAASTNEVYLNELIWREFFMMILYSFPYVVDKAFKPKYDFIEWRNSENEFYKWCRGETGYPIVDAGMRQLNTTGFMHNRLRMITAGFLCKHLLIDWRWGEAYFAQKLLDYELSSNNGNWQWAASTGCDAVPYFRMFNPDEQTKKFDPEFKYIQQWIPGYKPNKNYTKKIVDHKIARERMLQVYKNAVKKLTNHRL